MHRLQGKKILIVDDEELLRETLNEEFSSFGAEVFEAQNGIEAWTHLEKHDVDLVISDIRMAGGDGVSLLKAIKSKNRKRPSMVLASGFADFSAEDAFELGTAELLPKPFHLDQVLRIVVRFSYPIEARWSQVPEDLPPTIAEARCLRGSFSDFETHDFKFGYGGFYYKGPRIFIKADDWLKFEFKFPGSILPELSGTGKLKWLRVSRERSDQAEYGVLIETINQEAIRPLLSILDELPLPAVIPKPL